MHEHLRKLFMKNYFLPVVVLLSIVFASCSKDDDDKKIKPTPTRAELLTAKSWKMTASTVNPVNSPASITDLYSSMSACRKDAVFTFLPDSTLIIDYGVNCVSSGGTQIRNRKWALIQSDSVIREYHTERAGGFYTDNNIVSLSATELVLGGEQQDPSGLNFYKSTYTAQ